MDNEIFSNADIAIRLDVQLNSLNKRRSRMTSAGTLAEGTHWFKQDDCIFWTAAGVAALEGEAPGGLVTTEGQALSPGSDNSIPVGDFPSPATVAEANAPAVVARYLQAVDAEMAAEVTRLLREGDSLGKHLAQRWGIEVAGVSL